MRSITRMSFIVALLIGLSVTAHADVITDWNDKVVAAGVQARQAPFVHTRSVVIVHVAMFDALNSIDRRYTPYRVQVSPATGTSREVAAAAAAHFTLVRLYPDQAKDFELVSNVVGGGPGWGTEGKRYPAWRTGGRGNPRSASERRCRRTKYLPPIHDGGHLRPHCPPCRL